MAGALLDKVLAGAAGANDTRAAADNAIIAVFTLSSLVLIDETPRAEQYFAASPACRITLR
ncbi:MAG: hypothetical protein JO052_03125 [Bradyrhizobium sp.]|nr:hypothetical protein [Bradyrhizobium sp.]